MDLDTLAQIRHAAEILTYIMISSATGLHALVGFCKGLRKLAALTSTRADDEIAARLLATAEKLERGVSWVSRQHAKIFPQPSGGGQ